jgi:hypothetical protein
VALLDDSVAQLATGAPTGVAPAWNIVCPHSFMYQVVASFSFLDHFFSKSEVACSKTRKEVIECNFSTSLSNAWRRSAEESFTLLVSMACLL